MRKRSRRPHHVGAQVYEPVVTNHEEAATGLRVRDQWHYSFIDGQTNEQIFGTRIAARTTLAGN